MNQYDIMMRPLEVRLLGKLREKLIPMAKGDVLEIGIGTGVNLPYYNSTEIRGITGLDIKLSKKIKRKMSSRLTLVENGAENLPFEDGSFDTVVATLVLCSVEDIAASISEVKRVLKEGGRYIFIEHILPEEKKVAACFQRMNPCWARITKGCNINRASDLAIRLGGFTKLTIKKRLKGIFCYGVAKKL